MTPGDLLRELESRGIQLYVQAGFLRYRSPAGAFDTSIRHQTRSLRQTLVADWMCQRCEEIHRVFYGIQLEQLCRSCTREVACIGSK